MDQRDWLVYPWQVDAQVTAWQREFADLLDVTSMMQYTQHKVYGLTVTNKALPAAQKKSCLIYVPHAHEPAGTAGCMNFVHQLLTGHHIDGSPSTLNRELILREAVLSFIPDANPFGRARCPEPFWEGNRYNNREFINMVFGIGAQNSADPRKPQWERFKRVPRFSIRESAPARIGLVYEQISEHDYVEPGRYEEDATLVKLIKVLQEQYAYDQILTIHQTEFEGRDEDCEAILPGTQTELAEEGQRYNQQWAEALHEAWRGVGGKPRPDFRNGLFNNWSDKLQLHPRLKSDYWEELQRTTPLITLEIRNNHPETPAEQQLLLVDTAIWRSIEFMLNNSRNNSQQNSRTP